MKRIQNLGYFQIVLFLFLCFFSTDLKSQNYEERVTSASDVGLTISNLGLIGNAFKGDFNFGSPSAENPINSGVEHTFQGGLWLGGKVNGIPRVSTAYSDSPLGYSTGAENIEMTSDTNHVIIEKSNDPNSPLFSSDAVSSQDFISRFTDRNLIIPGTNTQITGHQSPMDVEVKFEAYNWDNPNCDFMVALDFEIINTGNLNIDSFYAGLLVNGVVRNVDSTPPGGSIFYGQGGNGYLESEFMSYDFDAEGDVGYSDSYQGQKFLGASDKSGFLHPDLSNHFDLNYNSWFFRNTSIALYDYPDTEAERYLKMKSGLNKLPCWDDVNDPACIAANGGSPPNQSYWEELRQAGNRSNLISVGPFSQFTPGDTIKVAFAMIYAPMLKNTGSNPIQNEDLASERLQLIDNADVAQTIYNGEDLNFNGILDSGEDSDGNGQITRYIIPNSLSLMEKDIVMHSDLELIQNPIINKQLNIRIFKASDYEITIQNLQGEIIDSRIINSNSSIKLNEEIKPGIYLLKWTSEIGNSGIIKFIITT